ncbi:MAG: CHASE2 domain-containing protein [Candidatus Omnitrophota bacterium]
MWFSDKRKPQEALSCKNFFIRFFLGIFIGIFVLIFYLNNSFERLELLTLDFRFKLRTPHKTNNDIALIEISDDSIQALGHWPWPRRYHAAMIEILRKYGAKIIGFDIIFSEPSDKINDSLLEQAIKNADNVYLAFSYNKIDGAFDISSGIFPLEIFADAGKFDGFINIDPDAHGFIRYADLFILQKSGIDYNFAFKIAMRYLGTDLNNVSIKDGFIEVPLKDEPILIPVDHQGKMIINWPGLWTETFNHYSFIDILNSYAAINNGETPFIDLNKFKNKICLIGVTATGLGDIKNVPIEPLYPGLGVHAVIINNILNKDFVKKTSDKLNVIIIFIFAMAVSFLISRVQILRGVLIILLFIIGWWYLAFILFEQKNIWLNFVYPAFTVFAGYVIVTLYNEIILARERMKLFKVSTIDGLTALFNKTYFTFLLQTEFSSMHLHKRKKLAVIMADIDHFKSINDTYGHQIGDFILKSVADIFKESCRPQDVIGRFGGEEMIVMLKDTDLGMAYQIAQRIRKNIEEHKFKSGQDTYQITISLGVSVFRDSDTVESLIKRADDALYQAKNEGRNKVCQEIPISS